MATREEQVATRLRADATLIATLTGGIYVSGHLGEAGITDPTTTPDAYSGGVLQPCAVVRQRARVPTGDLQDVVTQHTSMSQVVEVWVYAYESGTIEAALNRVYALLMGYKLGNAFRIRPAGSGPGIMQAPEMSPGVMTHHESYRLIFIRRPVTA